MMVIKAIITRVIEDSIIIHVEISLKIIVTVNQETEAMAVAEAITMVMVMVGPTIKAMLIINIISIMFTMISTRQINMVHCVLYAVAIITLPNTVLKESMISMILWKRLISTAINHSLVVYIPKGEHDNPHELPQQQDLEGSTKIDHTLYSYADTIMPTPNSSQKLKCIYQDFQKNEKVYESDPNLATDEIDSNLCPHINNDKEYGLFKDVINSYCLDSQIKDNFACDQNCHTNTQYEQHDETLTPCTHAYDHITQHVNNLDDPMQQHTVYTNEVDASLFTMDTTTPSDYNINVDMSNPNSSRENRPTPHHQEEFIPKVNTHTKMFLAMLTSNIMILIMVMHSLSQTNIQRFYNKNYKTLIGVYMTP